MSGYEVVEFQAVKTITETKSHVILGYSLLTKICTYKYVTLSLKEILH